MKEKKGHTAVSVIKASSATLQDQAKYCNLAKLDMAVVLKTNINRNETQISQICLNFGVQIVLDLWFLTDLKGPKEKYEPRHEKTGILHMRKQRRRSAAQ